MYTAAVMSASGFAIFCLLGFLLPVPLLVWLDRAPRAKSGPASPGVRAGESGR